MNDIHKAAKELGMTPEAFARRLKTMTFEEARNLPRQSKTQAAKKGAKASPWRRQRLYKRSRDFR